MSFNTLSDRLKLAMRDAGFTQSKLAEAVGISQGAIQKLTSGKMAGTTKLVEIARALNVRPEWLGFGAEPMRAENRAPHRESNIPPLSEWSPVDGWDDDTPLPDDEVYIPFYKDIEMAAGHGVENNLDYSGRMLRLSKSTLRRYSAQKENVAGFTLHGTSMLPVMPDKTTVILDMGNKKIIDGGIYGICQDGLCRLKLLYRLPGNKLSIRSYNKEEFPDEEADVDSVEIIGRVINWSVMAW